MTQGLLSQNIFAMFLVFAKTFSVSEAMKKDIHPEFKEVCFKDVSCDWTLITKSTIRTKETIEIDGKTYPLIKVDISSQSHPFYTGQQRLLDTEGRAEKFKKKYGLRRKKQ